MPGALSSDDVWDQPGVTEASNYDIPGEEYEAWVEANAIDVVLCDQNYQFDEVAGCASAACARSAASSGSTSPPSTSRARSRPTTSSTRSPAPSRPATPRWGSRAPTSPGAATRSCSRSARRAEPADDGLVRFVFPGGFLGHRKPIEPVIEAFTQTHERRHPRCWSRRRSSASSLKAILPAAEARRSDRAPARRRAHRRPPAARSPPTTSASRRRAGRASACRCTSRSRSGCR